MKIPSRCVLPSRHRYLSSCWAQRGQQKSPWVTTFAAATTDVHKMMFHWYLTPALHVRSSLSSVVVRGRTSLMNLCVLSQVRVFPKSLNRDDFHIAYYLPSPEYIACLVVLRTWNQPAQNLTSCGYICILYS
jgi:hypothetical protein